jgi:serine/threonine protein kinase
MINSQKNICLVDFGYSVKVESKEELISNYSGTPAYIAPEIIKKKPYNGKNN